MLTIFILNPLPQFNVDIIRQPHVRSIGIISTTLNWGVWGGEQIELYKHYDMTYNRSCVSTILSKIVAPLRAWHQLIATDLYKSNGAPGYEAAKLP